METIVVGVRLLLADEDGLEPSDEAASANESILRTIEHKPRDHPRRREHAAREPCLGAGR